MERKLNFDIAKAFCIVLVVMGHYYPSDSPEWYLDFRFLIYTFHMPLFLFASGYIYQAYKKDEPYRSFVKKKVRRLMIPYFVTSAIIISIKLLTQGGMHVENPVTYVSYLKMFYLPEAGYFLWFVWSLFAMFLIAPLFRTKSARLIAFVVAILVHYLSFDVTRVFALYESKSMFMWFMLGVCCFDFKIGEGLEKIGSWKYVVFAFVLGTFALLSRLDLRGYALYLQWIGIASIMVVSTLVARMSRQNLVMKLLVTLSSSSYIIYLFHTTFEGFAKSLWNKAGLTLESSDATFILGAFFIILCGVICPILLHRFVLSRFAVLCALFGLKYNANNSSLTN